MTKEKTQKALQKMAEGLRSKAAILRERKGDAAISAVSGLVNTGLAHGRIMQKYGEITTAAATSVVAVCEEIAENPHIQKQVVTLGANLIDNVAARIHELANIVESVSKSSKLQEAIVNAGKAAQGMAEAAGHFKAKAGKSMRRKFSVVRETKPPRKSSKKNSDKRTNA